MNSLTLKNIRARSIRQQASRITNNNNNNNILRLQPQRRSVSNYLANRATTTANRRSILHRSSQERLPHNNKVVFATTDDTTCVYPKGLALPLVEQATTVVKGASKLRASTRRVTMERYETSRISQTCGSRHVDFDLPVGAEAGLVTSTSSLYLKCRLLRPIREEETRKRRRSDAGLALELTSSKRVCLRAETASQVHRHGMKRKWIGSALERKFKRSCIRAGATQVQSEVVEVSRFIDCFLFLISISLLCLLSSSQSDISYCSIHLLQSCLAGSLYCRD